MKKSLLTLAALAVCGTAMAEVTITGEATYGYNVSSIAANRANAIDGVRATLGYAQLSGKGGNPNGNASGFGVDTATVTFKSVEDLGGGYKATASMNIDSTTRAGVSGGDYLLSLLTPVGLIDMKSYKADDYLTGTFNVAGVGTGLDGRVFGDRDHKDSIGFTTKLGPIYVGLSHSEAGNNPAAGSPPNLLGLGVGSEGSSTQRINSFSFSYVDGGLKANLNYLMYDNKTDGFDISRKDVIRAGAMYEAGDWKFGGGVSQGNLMSGAALKEFAVSTAYTMGSLTLGANYAFGQLSGTTGGAWVVGALMQQGLSAAAATATANGVAAAGGLDGNRSGYSLSAAYALSKRTSVLASYRNWVSSPFVDDRSSQTWMVLDHTF